MVARPSSWPSAARLFPSLLLALAACSPQSVAAPSALTSAKREQERAAPGEPVAWAPFAPETFARAKAEGKLVLMDGAAEWCHWCHVMEATTYHDPAVRAAIAKSFIAVKVDVDARPDLAERYGDYGWPATVVFSPDAEELGKYRGYIEPTKFVTILHEIATNSASKTEAGGVAPGCGAGFTTGISRPAPKTPLPEEQLAWIQRNVMLDLDEYWDPVEGSWGRRQKAPLGWDNAWTLREAERGDVNARAKALLTLDKQAALIDPVWGGIYQYSAAGDWSKPHYEKLMTFQAPALENYAAAYRLTGDPRHLARARAMQRYIDRFLTGPEGGFYTTQDADVNAHDRAKPFTDGHTYYALPARERLARGVPRVDTNEYGRENGLAIAAYAALYEATKDPAARATAERAARRILATHRTRSGAIAHTAATNGEEPKQTFLADHAAFGWGLARLYEATRDEEWLTESRAVADAMLRDLTDESGGGLFGATRDPDAVGVFAVRRVPFEDNVMALRHLARIARSSDDPTYRTAIGRILRAISVPEEIRARGRWLGDYLLALEETKGVR
ncbi:MAG: thioredoxin domain-containing protein [Labilithrix sp.]|nr:thioredoxin domain-containing protein [Labilithrix sp.]MCW5816857.1 thioredoxin domain-containing protein [Labilithrix sp.]